MNTGGNARVSPDEGQHTGEKGVGLELVRPRSQSELAVRDCKYLIRGRASRHPGEQAMMRVVLRRALETLEYSCAEAKTWRPLKAAMIIDQTMMLESGD